MCFLFWLCISVLLSFCLFVLIFTFVFCFPERYRGKESKREIMVLREKECREDLGGIGEGGRI